jgi:hypothetical protein
LDLREKKHQGNGKNYIMSSFLILKWILKGQYAMLGYVVKSAGSGRGSAVYTWEQYNETSRSVKDREYADHLNNCQLLKKDSVP